MNKHLILLMASLLLLLSFNAVVAEQKIVMEIEGMTCDLCTLAVKKSLSKIAGVKDVKVLYKEKKAFLTVDESITDQTLVNAVKNAGPYSAKAAERKPFD